MKTHQKNVVIAMHNVMIYTNKSCMDHVNTGTCTATHPTSAKEVEEVESSTCLLRSQNLVILDGAGAGLTKVFLCTEFSHPGGELWKVQQGRMAKVLPFRFYLNSSEQPVGDRFSEQNN